MQCEETKIHIHGLQYQHKVFKDQLDKVEKLEKIEFNNWIMQENETFEKAKTQVQCLSKLIDTSFQLWSHLQEEPEDFEKEHQIKRWE